MEVTRGTAPPYIVVTSTKTLSANNTSAIVPIFRVTGAVQVWALYGVVTTTLGTNVTAASWRFHDQSTQTVITASSGTTLSNGTVGSILAKTTGTGSALDFQDASARRLKESSSNHTLFQDFMLLQKTGANTDVEFLYTTTETPTSGAIKFYLRYTSITDGSSVAAV